MTHRILKPAQLERLSLVAAVSLALSACQSPMPVQQELAACKLEAQTMSWAMQYRQATVAVVLGNGSGSAVIISKEGLVMTAAHVVSKPGNEFTLLMEDGRRVRAKSLGVDTKADAAMMQILDEAPSGGWPFIPVGPTPTLGSWVLALGHAGGIVENRPPPLRLGRIHAKPEDGAVETDCTVVSGDSGGPLFDLEGHVVGINANISMDVDANRHVPSDYYLAHWEDLQKEQVLNFGFTKPAKPAAKEAQAKKPAPAPAAVPSGNLTPEQKAQFRSLVRENLEKMSKGKEVSEAMVDRCLQGSKFDEATKGFNMVVDPQTATELALLPGSGTGDAGDLEQFRGLVRQTLEKMSKGKQVSEAMVDRCLKGSKFNPENKQFSLGVDPQTAKELGIDGQDGMDRDEFIRGIIVLAKSGDKKAIAMLESLKATGAANNGEPAYMAKIKEAAKQIPRSTGDRIPDYMREIIRNELGRSLARQIGRKLDDKAIDMMLNAARYEPKTGTVHTNYDLGLLGQLGLSPKELRALMGKGIDVKPELRDNGPQAIALMQPAMEAGKRSTVLVFKGAEQLALGTVVSTEGEILTKASQLNGETELKLQLADGTFTPATLAAIDYSTDLALLRTRTAGLTPVTWGDEPPALGSWIISPLASEDKQPAVAVVSLPARPIPAILKINAGADRRVWLGLGPALTENAPEGYVVAMVAENSPAAKAGIIVGDRIIKADDKQLKKPSDLVDYLRTLSAGYKLKLVVLRADAEQVLEVELEAPADGAFSGGSAAGVTDLIAKAGGDISLRRMDFPQAIQHDGVVWTASCGGPVVDLHGRTVAVNIARFDRICTFALSAEEAQAALKRLRAIAR